MDLTFGTRLSQSGTVFATLYSIVRESPHVTF